LDSYLESAWGTNNFKSVGKQQKGGKHPVLDTVSARTVDSVGSLC